LARQRQSPTSAHPPGGAHSGKRICRRPGARSRLKSSNTFQTVFYLTNRAMLSGGLHPTPAGIYRTNIHTEPVPAAACCAPGGPARRPARPIWVLQSREVNRRSIAISQNETGAGSTQVVPFHGALHQLSAVTMVPHPRRRLHSILNRASCFTAVVSQLVSRVRFTFHSAPHDPNDEPNNRPEDGRCY
jgi:hypothetical protein